MLIAKEWLRSKVTVESVEALTHLDRIRGVVPFEFTAKDVVDKNSWYNELTYKNDPRWIVFKNDIQDGDELWYFECPSPYGMIVQNNMGLKGYAIIRDGKVYKALHT
jgi:outer membrane protein assembly factor BamB